LEEGRKKGKIWNHSKRYEREEKDEAEEGRGKEEEGGKEEDVKSMKSRRMEKNIHRY
jgi:hypothetical protein